MCTDIIYTSKKYVNDSIDNNNWLFNLLKPYFDRYAFCFDVIYNILKIVVIT